MRHLNDEQLQAFMHRDTTHIPPRMVSHLEQCSSCREKLTLYLQISHTLKDQIPVIVPLNFADRVMSKLPETPFWKRHGFREKIALLPAAVFILTAIIYALSKTAWIRGYSDFIASFSRIPHALGLPLNWISTVFNGGFIWLFLGACILTLWMVIDRIIAPEQIRYSHIPIR